MVIRKKPDIASSDITPHRTYLTRREWVQSTAGVLTAALLAPASALAAVSADKLTIAKRMVTTNDVLTPFQAVTSYNNFYEFGTDTDHGDPARHASALKPHPWSVTVEGACAKPGVYALEDILKPHPIEERVYRMRCVEGWSMVIPWDGFPLGDLLKRFVPNGSAKFVEFTSVLRPQEMVGQRQRFPEILPWPYVEGLRMDEAVHPLALIAVGVYGQELPNQNGAPLRLVVPWKYGFKGIKSIVKIKFTDKQPKNTWQASAPDYYSFYSNVNPGRTNSTFRDQSTERRIGEFLMRKTLMFNGYAEQVASLYTGLDLKKNY